MKLVCDTCGCEKDIPETSLYLSTTAFILAVEKAGWRVRTDWVRRGRMLRFCSPECMKKHGISRQGVFIK